MKRFVLAIAAFGALLAPATATAKGPSLATISGPGLKEPVKIQGNGEGGSTTALGVLATEAGFFPQVFGQTPDPLLRSQPTRLGARYSVVYTVPGPSTADTLRQDLYPYAAGGPVSYMAPGQHFWDQVTHGGWYRTTAGGQLSSMLVRAGLPKNDPFAAARRVRASAKGSHKVGIAIGTGAGVALAAGALVLLRRRR